MKTVINDINDQFVSKIVIQCTGTKATNMFEMQILCIKLTSDNSICSLEVVLRISL